MKNSPAFSERISKMDRETAEDVRYWLWNFFWLVVAIITIEILIHPAHAFRISCNTDSMYPALDCTSKYRLERYNNTYKDIKIGDIVVFNADSGTRWKYKSWFYVSYVYHRVINITKSGNYITKGDNNDYADPFEVRPHWVKWKITPIKS